MIIEKERMWLEEYINCKCEFKKFLMFVATSNPNALIRLALEMIFVSLYLVSWYQQVRTLNSPVSE